MAEGLTLGNEEEELRRQAALLDLTHEAILVRDFQTNAVRFWNRGAEEIYGWSREEAVGRSSHTLLQTAFPEPMHVIQAELVRTGRWECELIHTTRDGRRIVVDSRWALQRSERGDPIATLEINRDVTERKQVEEQLRDALLELRLRLRDAKNARTQARAVLDAASDAIILLSRQGRFLNVNRRFSEIFAVDPDLVLGRRVDHFTELVERMFADAAACLPCIVGSARDPDRRLTKIVVQRWPEHRELQLHSTPVRSPEGQHLGRLLVFHDVTHEREVDRMRREFVSTVSHELRSPLTSIKGYVDLLLDGQGGEVPEAQREFLTIVKNNADCLVAIVNDLLDLSRIEAGKIQLQLTPLQLPVLVDRVVSSLRPQIDAKGQRLTIDIPDGSPCVLGDADRVTQIVTNLLSNACKYTPEGGSITISARPQDEHVRVNVSDTGVGLSPDEQSQIFARFFRARNRATQEVAGTGLGLAITRSLVELHGGTITVASAPGEGSTFTLTLPSTAEELAAAITHGIRKQDSHDRA